MGYPNGVSLAVISGGTAFTAFGDDVPVQITVTPRFPKQGGGFLTRIIHAATGWVMTSDPDTFTAEAGTEVSFSVPHVDQDGFRDPAQNAYTGWYYEVKVVVGAARGRTKTAYTQTVSPVVGQALVDLDLVPEGQTGNPQSVAVPEVISVAGYTGAVSITDLQEAGLGGAADPDIAGLIQSTTSSTYNALTEVSAPVSVGRSVTDFGASPAALASENHAAFTDAMAWTQSNAFGAKTVFIPPVADGQFFELIAPVIVPAGVTVQGAGRMSRVRSVVKPNPCFRTAEGAKNVTFRNFSVHGLADRYLEEGGWERENHRSLHYSGVTFQAGADGGLVENLYGENLACVANAWAYADSKVGYDGRNIQGLTFRGIEGKDVWGVVFVRETDNLVIDDVSGTYSRPTGSGASPLAAPAHLVYVTSSSALAEGETPRKLRGVTMTNLRARSGSYGAAFAIKHVVGGTITNIVAEDCEGLWDINGLDGVTISNARSVADKRPWSTTVASLHTLNCANTTIESPVIDFAEGDHGRALYVDAGSSNIVVRDMRVNTRHTVTQNGADYAEVGMYGTDCRLERPVIVWLGQPRNGMALSGTRNVVTEPRFDGFNRGIQIMASAVDARVEGYNPDLMKFKTGISTTFWKMDAVAGSTFKITPGEYGAVAWDRQRLALGSARAWNYTDSGHATNLKGNWRLDNSGRVESYTTGAFPRIATVSAGTPNVEIESTVLLSAANSNPDAGQPVWAGQVFRSNNGDEGMGVELSTTAVKVSGFYVNSGFFRTEVASVARTLVTGRKYRVRTVVYGDQVQVFLDGALVIDAVIPTDMMTRYGAATLHGHAQQQMAGSRFTDLTIRSL